MWRDCTIKYILNTIIHIFFILFFLNLLSSGLFFVHQYFTSIWEFKYFLVQSKVIIQRKPNESRDWKHTTNFLCTKNTINIWFVLINFVQLSNNIYNNLQSCTESISVASITWKIYSRPNYSWKNLIPLRLVKYF